MIQCVGPAEKYCSRICCTNALKNAYALKKSRPDLQIQILYRDIRVYGLMEQLYTEVRDLGVLFFRYDDEHKPELNINPDGKTTASLQISIMDLSLRQQIKFRTGSAGIIHASSPPL